MYICHIYIHVRTTIVDVHVHVHETSITFKNKKYSIRLFYNVYVHLPILQYLTCFESLSCLIDWN